MGSVCLYFGLLRSGRGEATSNSEASLGRKRHLEEGVDMGSSAEEKSPYDLQKEKKKAQDAHLG